MNIKQILKQLALVSSAFVATASPFAPTTFFQPYDPNLRLPEWRHQTIKVGAVLEYGTTSRAQNWNGKRKNILQIHNDTESTIAMLQSANDSGAAKYQLQLLDGDPGSADYATDDGTRGHVELNGDFSEFQTIVYGQYKLPSFDFIPGALKLEAHLPVKSIKVDNVRRTDKTLSTTDTLYLSDDLVKNYVVGLDDSIKTLGSNLSLGNFSKTGIGDTVLMLYWDNNFKQDKTTLKNVNLYAKLGLSIPTGVKKDQDKAFSFALGNDKAWGLPAGLGIGLDFKYHIRAGADVEFLVLFDETHDRRMKTTKTQTDFLLLNKGRATMDHGLTWKFNLFLQAFQFMGGFSAKFAYEYIKHDDDRLHPKNNDFNYDVVNSAKSLSEWNSHNLIFQANYDFFDELYRSVCKPQIGFFYKLPVGGKNIVDAQTIGGQLTFNF